MNGMSADVRRAADAPRAPAREGSPSRRDGVSRVERVSARPPRASMGLYVHIPFCAARCPYCDFATAPALSALRSRYMDALDTEIRREGGRLRRPRVDTLFFGGGTPSLLEPAEVTRLGAALRESFDLRPAEAT